MIDLEKILIPEIAERCKELRKKSSYSMDSLGDFICQIKLDNSSLHM